jgi:hypothetical protein
MESLYFAVVPDLTGRVSAVFAELEDAIAWALKRFGGDAFAIRRFDRRTGGPDTGEGYDAATSN